MEKNGANRNRKVTASRRKDVYNRTGEPSVTFCERGNAEKRADVFLARKTEQSELCSDMVETEGLEPATSRM